MPNCNQSRDLAPNGNGNVGKHTPDIIAIGASAGGVQALKYLASQLPGDLDAALFAVIHLAARSPTYLADILERAGPLPAITASDGARIRPGMIYVAAPDHHLLVANDHMHLSRGPKEGRHRPSINVTFRSAAMSYGQRVIGVILTGMLDDGTAGLWEIKMRGGITIVQDPGDAQYPSMPSSALDDVKVDYQADLAHLGELLTGLVRGAIELPESHRQSRVSDPRFSGLTCPECRGPIWQVRSKPVEFRCRVGHVYSPQSMLEDHAAVQERKLYEAILALQEGADIAEFMAARNEGPFREQLLREAEQIRAQSEVIKGMVENVSMGSVGVDSLL